MFDVPTRMMFTIGSPPMSAERIRSPDPGVGTEAQCLCDCLYEIHQLTLLARGR